MNAPYAGQVESTLVAHAALQCSESRPGFHRRWVLCECGDGNEYTTDQWEAHRAEEIVALFAPALQAARAKAWDEGQHAGVLNVTGPYDLDPVDNPYEDADL